MSFLKSWISLRCPRCTNVLGVLAVLLMVAMSAVAQVSTANVSGEVEDASGARLTAVTIKLLNLQTGNENTASTDPRGDFLIPGVLPGLYSMQVQRDGFAAVHLTGLNLNVGDSRQFVIKLRVSTVEQTVEVDASGQSLNTEDAQMTTVVDSHLVHDLPLNGRSFQDLIAMTPGAVSVSPQVPRNGGFSVNGQPSDTNTYWVDGISGNFGSGPLDAELKVPAAGQYASLTSVGTTHGLVALDALQEFRVVASTASAEYGSSPGGQFNLLTRQGADQIHATAYAYIRNGYFDAVDWFGKYDAYENDLYYYQQDIGGTIGVPLMLGKSGTAPAKTHLFGSYEETHLQERTAPVIQYDPDPWLTYRAPPPVQAAFLAFPNWGNPEDEGPSQSPGLDVIWVLPPSPPSFLKSMDYRADRTFGSRFSGFLRFGNTPSGSESVDLLTKALTKLSNQSITAGLEGQLSSHTGNEFRLGWARSASATISSIMTTPPNEYYPSGGDPFDLPSTLGTPGASSNTHSEIYMRIAGVGDTAAWTDGGTNALRQLEIRDTFSWQHGSHLIRAGIDERNLHSAVQSRPWTIEADYLSANSVLTNSADFLILRRNEPAHPVFQQFAAFIQDQWRLKPNLTINAGLRWDIDPPPGSSDGRNAFRVNGNPNAPATLSISPRGTPLWRTDWFAVGPRMGVAWQPARRQGRELVLRSGFGVLFDNPDRAAAPAFAALGFTSTNVARNASIPSTQPVPANPETPSSESLGYAFPRNLRNPYSLQWNVSLEQATGQHASAVFSYVGSSGHGLLLPQRQQVAGLTTPLQELVTFPSGYSSRYDSFQAAYHGQLGSRLSWMSSYTWAHAIDFGSPNPWATPTRGNADTDVRHNLEAAGSWLSSRPSNRNFFLYAFAGWAFDGRYLLRSSYPVTVLGNLFHDPVTGERFYSGSDLVAGRPIYLANRLLPGRRMLNGGPTAPDGAFQLPAGTSQGNAPRNMARAFDARQLSLSMWKDVHLYERLTLQLRADAFNVFNNPDFGYINPTLTDQLFGQPILSLNQSYGQSGSLYQPGGPRSLQWMFRLRW